MSDDNKIQIQLQECEMQLWPHMLLLLGLLQLASSISLEPMAVMARSCRVSCQRAGCSSFLINGIQ